MKKRILMETGKKIKRIFMETGVMERTIFSQFKMDVTQFFKSAQRRKANEGVRIANLDPTTRMNSCNEFRQGTNIMMRPVRGVGV